MFVESKWILDYNKKVKTPFGYQRIESVHKTPPLEALEISFGGGSILVAKFHTFVVNGEEISASDLKVGDFLETPNGVAAVTTIKDAGVQELYDITLDQSDFENYWYYSNGVLSHNSGKSITVACYLAWLFNFFKDINIGIVANRAAQAREFLQNTKDIYSRLPIWLVQGLTTWNKTTIANEIGTRILTDVPTGDSFRGFSINCLIIDECAFIQPSRWEEFADSIFPSQSALSWKKNIIISTAKGLNHFYEIVQKAKLESTNPESKSTLVEVAWDEVPRYDSKGNLIPPEKFREQIIKRYGHVYFEQNYGNSFVGSSETLLSPEALQSLTASETLHILDDMLNVFEEPKEDHVYLMGVDAAKEGKDFFAVQVLDITSLPFKQVATAKLQVNYLTMPDFLYEWGAYFNTAHMIIENNEGAGQSIADMMVNHFEYPNVYFQDSKFKYPGFRTTKQTRDMIIRLLQVLMNSNKLEIRDKETILEFQKFELVNGKYQASSGHDDLIMALALSLAPIANMENFSDFGKFLNALKSSDPLDSGNFLELGDLAFEDF